MFFKDLVAQFQYMKFKKWLLRSILALSFLVFHFVQARTYQKMDLSPLLKAELNLVLKAAADLQQASFARQEREFDSNLNQLIANLTRAHEKSNAMKVDGPHLGRILLAARFQLLAARKSTGEKRHENLREAFSQIVQLAQIYKLDSYKIFFCPTDQSVWLQTSKEAQNPIHPATLGSCGHLVK